MREKNMAKDITWLTDLKSEILEGKDKQNFDDLICCYQNDLLRAGFVMAWLMLVESLKRKVVDLAAKGVKVALKQKENIEKIEESLQSNDMAIMKAALDCDLITKEENSVLELLWKKRCIMSHPYMPNVSESDFRYMVENLVSISLSKTVLWSHSMIEDFFKDIKNSLFIIPNTEESRKEFAYNTLALIPMKSWPFFWKTLFYEYSISINTGKKKQTNFLRQMAVLFVTLPSVNINDAKYTLDKQIKDHCAVCWRIFSRRSTWKKLDKVYQGQLFRFLEDNKGEANKVLEYAARLVSRADDLDEEYLNCYNASLNEYDVLDVERYYLDKDVFLDRLYKDKISGYQFDEQGQYVDWIRGMSEEEIADYTPIQLRRLGKYMHFCCLTGTFKAQDFVRYYYHDWINHFDFVKGFVMEKFIDDDGNLSIDFYKMDYTYIMLDHLTEEQRLDIIAEINKLSLTKPCDDPDECYYIRHEIGKKYPGDTPEGKALKPIIDKYCIAEIEEDANIGLV